MPFKSGPQTAPTAPVAPVTVTHGTVPIGVTVRTPWEAVELPPITVAIMPGRDNVVLFVMAMMKELGIDSCLLASDKVRLRLVPVQTSVENSCYLALKPVIASVRSFRSTNEEGSPSDVAV